MRLCVWPAVQDAASPGPRSIERHWSVSGAAQSTQLTTSSAFLERADGLWPGIEVTLRSKRVAELIEQHDEYLKKRGWYDAITATLDENWIDDAVDGYLDAGDPD